MESFKRFSRNVFSKISLALPQNRSQKLFKIT